MDAEERFLEAITEENGSPSSSHWWERRRERLQSKNLAAINDFFGNGSRIYTTGILPRYYGELLTWALWCYMEREGWKILGTLGYRGPEPIYTEVNTSNGKLNFLMNGQILIERDGDRYTVTVDIDPRLRGLVQVEGLAVKQEEMRQFIIDVLTIAHEENFYRGKKVEFTGRIRFLDVETKAWDSIVLDVETKTDIKANTINFLKQGERWSQYGIPTKRGVLLAGEPGTGKTVICKALMSEAEGVTCITTNGYALDSDDYITELYELAKDLSPSIVFIEDIDLIGQNREEFGYQRGPALLSLLAMLDGIEERREIVTVATTNCLETLDKALNKRPSRFDRIIKLSPPSIEQRQEIVHRLCQKIPLEEDIQEYIAQKTHGYTPAQVQEIVRSLIIQCPPERVESNFDRSDVDRAVSSVTDSSRRRLGFAESHNHNGHKLDQITIIGGWQ